MNLTDNRIFRVIGQHKEGVWTITITVGIEYQKRPTFKGTGKHAKLDCALEEAYLRAFAKYSDYVHRKEEWENEQKKLTPELFVR